MTDEEEDLGGLLGLIVRHPEIGEVWLIVVANLYLGWQAFGGVIQREQGGWLTALILAPFFILMNAIAIMLVKLSRAIRKANERQRERARLEEESRRAVLLVQAHRAFSQHRAFLEAQEALRKGPHAPSECPGPRTFPDSDETRYWDCARCRSTWVWTYGLQWEQRESDTKPDLPF